VISSLCLNVCASKLRRRASRRDLQPLRWPSSRTDSKLPLRVPRRTCADGHKLFSFMIIIIIIIIIIVGPRRKPITKSPERAITRRGSCSSANKGVCENDSDYWLTITHYHHPSCVRGGLGVRSFDSFRFARTDISAQYARVVLLFSFLILFIQNYNIFMYAITDGGEAGVFCILLFCETFVHRYSILYHPKRVSRFISCWSPEKTLIWRSELKYPV